MEVEFLNSKNRISLVKFVDLVFPGKLHEDLKNSETVEFEFLRAEIEEAWELAPLEIVSRLKTLSNSNYTSYRGIIFELYIMRKLLKAGFSLQYEYSSRGMNSSLDLSLIHI